MATMAPTATVPMLLLVALLAHGLNCACAGDQRAAPPSTSIDLEVSDAGAYSVLVNGYAWLRSAPIVFRVNGKNYSTADGTLTPAHAGKAKVVSSGSDSMGKFTTTMLAWTAGGVPVETEFRLYAGIDAVVFLQHYPEGAEGTATPPGGHTDATVSAAFPAFNFTAAATAELPQRAAPRANAPVAFVQFAGQGVPNAGGCRMGPWPPVASAKPATRACTAGGRLDDPRHYPPMENKLSSGWEATGALAIFDAEASSTIVVSPFAGFTTTQATQVKDTLNYGPRGSIKSLPKGFTSGVIVMAGQGVGLTMRKWGVALMRKAGKNPDAWKEDYSLNYLGYTTDNGAYYYYKTEDGKNYEETILDLKAYTVAEKIPIKWILYDSWFYKKCNDTGRGMMDPVHGAVNWTDADPAIFPSGLRYIYRATGWPVVAHARAWASAADGNVYSKANPGGWLESPNLDGEVVGLPVDVTFWDTLFENAREWGCLQYQQDWMYTQGGMQIIRENATLSHLWHKQMTDALQRHGMRFGFGGVMPDDWLMSTEQQAVTNGRISNDYHANLNDEGGFNWNIGTASIFGWALSVIPAKDGFWTTPVQPGHPYIHDNRTENLSALHGAVASLSRGPVSPADKIGLFNRTLIMRACMDDGTLLTPDRPALALDSTLLHRARFGTASAPGATPNGEIWSTMSTLGGLTYRHVLVPLLREAYTLTPTELMRNDDIGFAPNGELIFENAFDYSASLAYPFGESAPLGLKPCDRTDFKLYHTVPLLGNGWGLVGESSKWIPVSPVRVKSVSYTGNNVTLELSGAAGEAISFGFVYAPPPMPAGGVKIQYVSCVFSETGTLTMTPSGCLDSPW